MLCEYMCMPSNLAIDDKLLADALRLSRHATKRETVNEALREFIQRRRRVDIKKLFGTIEYDPAYDYKSERRKR